LDFASQSRIVHETLSKQLEEQVDRGESSVSMIIDENENQQNLAPAQVAESLALVLNKDATIDINLQGSWPYEVTLNVSNVSNEHPQSTSLKQTRYRQRRREKKGKKKLIIFATIYFTHYYFSESNVGVVDSALQRLIVNAVEQLQREPSSTANTGDGVSIASIRLRCGSKVTSTEQLYENLQNLVKQKRLLQLFHVLECRYATRKNSSRRKEMKLLTSSSSSSSPYLQRNFQSLNYG
jgi:hypothetical protein